MGSDLLYIYCYTQPNVVSENIEVTEVNFDIMMMADRLPGAIIIIFNGFRFVIKGIATNLSYILILI